MGAGSASAGGCRFRWVLASGMAGGSSGRWERRQQWPLNMGSGGLAARSVGCAGCRENGR